MVASARDPRLARIAQVLAGAPGPATVAGAASTAAPHAATTANAFLMHAQLADDAYRLAEHAGLAVLPVALAAAEHDVEIDGAAWLRAVVGGYEAACVLADLLLPDASQRGWRVTAAVAPTRDRGDRLSAASGGGVGRPRRDPARRGDGRRPAGRVRRRRCVAAAARARLGAGPAGGAGRRRRRAWRSRRARGPAGDARRDRRTRIHRPPGRGAAHRAGDVQAPPGPDVRAGRVRRDRARARIAGNGARRCGCGSRRSPPPTPTRAPAA